MQFDLGFSRVLLKLTREFREPADWWSGRHHRVLNFLTRIVEGGPKEEWAGGFMNQVEELNLDDVHRCILYLWRARNLYRRERLEEALTAFRKARRYLREEDEALSRKLADGFNAVGWKFGLERGVAIPSHDAKLALKEAVTLDAAEGRHWIGLGVMRYGLGENEKAVEDLEKGIELEGEKAYSLNWLGNVYDDLGRHEEAIAAYQRAIDLDPEYAYPHNNLGNVYYQLGRYEEAIAAYQRAIDLDPEDAYPHNNLGNVYADLGQHKEAIGAYQRAIELDPELATPRVGLAGVYRHIGDTDASRHHAEQSRQLLAPDAYSDWACIESIAGNTDAALEHLAKALERAPGKRDWARRDPDLAFIRDDPRFQALMKEEK
jgi:tetratricopeptide (TPR) repeat protein